MKQVDTSAEFRPSADGLGLRQRSCRFRSRKSKAVAVRQPTDTALQGACWNSNPTDVESGSVQKSFELLKPWIRSCHINDLERKEYPWHELFALLRGINFDRYTFAEVGEPSCEPIRFMNYYRALWDYTAGRQRP